MRKSIDYYNRAIFMTLKMTWPVIIIHGYYGMIINKQADRWIGIQEMEGGRRNRKCVQRKIGFWKFRFSEKESMESEKRASLPLF